MGFRRRRFGWRIREGELQLGAETLVMGVVDLSPAAAGERPDPDQALEQARRLAEAGADLIDVTVLPPVHPNRRLAADEERRRLTAALRKLKAHFDRPYSVCTYNAETAERALELGASAINDPSGLALDPNMARLVNQTDAGLVLGFAPAPPELWGQGRPTALSFEATVKGLASALARARLSGIDRRRVVLDLSLGVAKRPPQNYELLERLREVSRLNQPLLASPSRRPFLTDSIRAPKWEWTISAAAAAALAVRGGVHIVRGYEAAELRAAARLGDRLLAAAEEA